MPKECIQVYGIWFPRDVCDDHQAEFIESVVSCEKHSVDAARPHDMTKELRDWSNCSVHGMGLFPYVQKTYNCFGGSFFFYNKKGINGLNKTQNYLTKHKFFKVLQK